MKQRKRDNASITSKRSKLLQKKQRVTELFLDGLMERGEHDRRIAEIDNALIDLAPVPELPEIRTDFKEMYSKLTNEKKAVFWRAFIDHITLDRERNVNVVYHTAKVLAVRLSTLSEIVE